MIFSLFLICAFNVQNTCTVSGTDYAGLLACPHSRANAGCYTECETACKLEDSATNAAACEAGLDCFDGTTDNDYFAGADACNLADPASTNRLDCVKACYDYCEDNGGAEKGNAPCKKGIPCYDTAALANCKTFCGVNDKKAATETLCVETIPCLGDLTTRTVVTACGDWCTGAHVTDTGTLCADSLPCAKGTVDGAATCAQAATKIDCLDECVTWCNVAANNVGAGKTACDTNIKCYDLTIANAPTDCKAVCDAGIVKSDLLLALCQKQLPCDVDFGADVCGLYMDDEVGAGCTLQECDNWCASGKPGYDTTNCTTKKALCTSDPCNNLPSGATGCKLDFCKTLCAADVDESEKTDCERELPCWDGSSSVHGPITGKPACDKVVATSLANADAGCIPGCIAFCDVANNYAVTANKDSCDAAVPCYDVSTTGKATTCNTWCSSKPALTDFCELHLRCTAEFGTDACEDFMSGGEAGCTFAQCTAYCAFAGHESETICEAEEPGKCNTEPCKHKIPSTGPTNTLYCHADLCTAFCASDPCSTAKSTDCAAECTTWCADSTNAESELCPEGEGSSYSIVLSLFVLLLALL